MYSPFGNKDVDPSFMSGHAILKTALTFGLRFFGTDSQSEGSRAPTMKRHPFETRCALMLVRPEKSYGYLHNPIYFHQGSLHRGRGNRGKSTGVELMGIDWMLDRHGAALSRFSKFRISHGCSQQDADKLQPEEDRGPPELHHDDLTKMFDATGGLLLHDPASPSRCTWCAHLVPSLYLVDGVPLARGLHSPSDNLLEINALDHWHNLLSSIVLATPTCLSTLATPEACPQSPGRSAPPGSLP